MKKRYWLHYYSQRRPVQQEPNAANTVSDKSPAAFLKYLTTDFPDNDNLLMWSTEISAAEFKSLDGHI